MTNMESSKTNNFYEQEITFQYSDIVIFISKSEKKHYKNLGYDKYNAKQYVIYNSYQPKFDFIENKNDYKSNNLVILEGMYHEKDLNYL